MKTVFTAMVKSVMNGTVLTLVALLAVIGYFGFDTLSMGVAAVTSASSASYVQDDARVQEVMRIGRELEPARAEYERQLVEANNALKRNEQQPRGGRTFTNRVDGVLNSIADVFR